MILGGIGEETEEGAKVCHAIAAALRAPDATKITDPLGAAYRAYAQSNPDNDLEALALSALQMWPEGYPGKLGDDGLRHVRNPVLVVNGANDHPYVDSAGPLTKLILGAQLVTIPGTDHLSTVPDPCFKQAVLEYMDRH